MRTALHRAADWLLWNTITFVAAYTVVLVGGLAVFGALGI